MDSGKKAFLTSVIPLLLVSFPPVTEGLGFWQAASAATLYVDNQLSGDCQETYSIANRDCSGADGDAYDTIEEAANIAVAGDIVLIRTGSYSEPLMPANSGAVGDYITFKNYANELVVIVTGSSMAIDISDRDYIIIEGLNINDSRWLEARNSHHNIIRNNSFARTPATGTTGNVRFISSSYNQILYNAIQEGKDNLLLIDSERNVVEGNTITESRHSIWGIRCGDYNIIRNNFFSNTQQKIGEVYDCGEDTSAVPNSFDSTKHNLIERNVFAGTGGDDSISGGNGIQYSGQDGIVRRNVFYSNNVGLGMQVYSDEALYNTENRVYHNTFYDNSCAGVSLRDGQEGNIFKNNILFWNKGVSGDCFGTGPAQIVYRGDIGGYVFERNNIINQVAGEDVIYQLYGSGHSLSYFESNFPSLYLDNLEVDPAFVDASANDFHLQSDSPMIDAGTFLTSTAGAGSGTVMQVDDAGYFYDGFGISGEVGDLIRLDGQTVTARIVTVDYDTHTLTLNTSLTWTAGQGISLAYSGSAPDIGAYEYDGIAPVYRFWSPVYLHHFYTISASERDSVLVTYPDVWTYESEGFYAFEQDSEEDLEAVFRFWSPTYLAHFYTIDPNERDSVIAMYPDVWTYECPAFYAYPEGSEPVDASAVYRFWSPMYLAHFYTISEAEKDNVIATWPDAWHYEGIAWYAYEP